MKLLKHGDINKHQWGSKKRYSNFCFGSYPFVDFTVMLKKVDGICLLETHLRI